MLIPIERGQYRPSPDSPKPLAFKEFMKIRDTELAKSAIINVVRDRLSHPGRADSVMSGQDVNEGLRFISDVFDYAAEKHRGKKRLTGEDYIFHPAAIAYKVVKDKHIPVHELIIASAASLCHDVLEDTLTKPSELREELRSHIKHEEIADQATADVILLSKKIKAFDDVPKTRSEELAGIRCNPQHSVDEIELLRWIGRREGGTLLKTQLYLDDIINGPDRVRRIKLADREHNMRTLPPRIAPEGVTRSGKEQEKVDQMYENIDKSRRTYIRMALSLGITGIAIAESLRDIRKEMKRQ